MKKNIRRYPAINQSFSAEMHPLLQRVYANRGVTSMLETECTFDHLLPYHLLKGIDQAADCLSEAVRQQQRILIVGDFDADGATSTVVAIRALKSFGAKQVDYLVPNRFAFGYGLTPELVQVAIELKPDLIVTVDNGIANHAGVAAAKAADMQVVITDHHLPAETLPIADAIVNPNQRGDTFPSKSMAGVGVIFYVMLALRRRLSELNWFQQQSLPEPNMSRLLDVVALGTVADVVSLDHNNRILVHQGLGRIRSGQCAQGILALLEQAKKDYTRVRASDLGFSVAPKINAAGRLDDMSLGIECLLCDDALKAREMAAVLNQLNEERQLIERDMQAQALMILKKVQAQLNHIPAALCLYEENWHQGVIGILAGRLKDRFHRPVIAFAAASDDEIKGSARSIPGLHIRDILAEIDAKHPTLIKKFGGHAMAAGLTLSPQAFKSFAAHFNQVVEEKVAVLNLQHELLSDGELQSHEFSLEIADLLRHAGPWGQSFPEPMFDGVFQIIEQRLVGGRHLKLSLEHHTHVIDAIAFNVNVDEWPNHRCQSAHLAYRLDVNEYRGKRRLQLIVEQLEDKSP